MRITQKKILDYLETDDELLLSEQAAALGQIDEENGATLILPVLLNRKFRVGFNLRKQFVKQIITMYKKGKIVLELVPSSDFYTDDPRFLPIRLRRK